VRHYVDYCVGLSASSKQQGTEQGRGGRRDEWAGSPSQRRKHLGQRIDLSLLHFLRSCTIKQVSFFASAPTVTQVRRARGGIHTLSGWPFRNRVQLVLLGGSSSLFVIPRTIAVSTFPLGGRGAEDITNWVRMHLPGHFVQLPRDTSDDFDIRRRDIAIPIVVLPTIDAILTSVRIPPTSTRYGCRDCRGTIVTIPRECRG
jgi:hypothetical protein